MTASSNSEGTPYKDSKIRRRVIAATAGLATLAGTVFIASQAKNQGTSSQPRIAVIQEIEPYGQAEATSDGELIDQQTETNFFINRTFLEAEIGSYGVGKAGLVVQAINNSIQNSTDLQEGEYVASTHAVDGGAYIMPDLQPKFGQIYEELANNGALFTTLFTLESEGGYYLTAVDNANEGSAKYFLATEFSNNFADSDAPTETARLYDFYRVEAELIDGFRVTSLSSGEQHSFKTDYLENVPLDLTRLSQQDLDFELPTSRDPQTLANQLAEISSYTVNHGSLRLHSAVFPENQRGPILQAQEFFQNNSSAEKLPEEYRVSYQIDSSLGDSYVNERTGLLYVSVESTQNGRVITQQNLLLSISGSQSTTSEDTVFKVEQTQIL